MKLRHTITAAALAAAAVPASAGGVSIAQHALPGSDSGATAIQGWAGGLEITRGEGQAKTVMQPIATTPSFAAGTVQHVEAPTLGVGPDGDLWIVAGQPGPPGTDPGLVLEDVPPTGPAVPRYVFPGASTGLQWPEAFASAPDGSVWVADIRADAVERIAPGGQATAYHLGPLGAPSSIAVAADGSVWFTEPEAGAVGEITPQGTLVERGVVPSQGLGTYGSSEPYSIAAGPDGALWFTEQAAGAIGRITVDGAIEQFTIPVPAGTPPGDFGAPAPRDIAVGPDGALWFTDDGEESIGRITTSGAIGEYPIPANEPPSPQQITTYRGELWFAEAGLRAIGSVEPAPAARTAAAAPPRRRAPARHRCPHRSGGSRRHSRLCASRSGRGQRSGWGGAA